MAVKVGFKDGSQWTAERVREELPPVPVQVKGKIITGHVCGRKLDYAYVSVGPGGFEVSWATLANVLNRRGAYVIVD